MSSRTGAELAELRELRRVLGARADDLAEEARAVDAAIGRFRARSSQYVPHLPPHGARGLELAAQLDELGLRTERDHDQLRHADRSAATRIGLWLYHRDQDRRAVQGVADGLWYGGRGSWSMFRRWVLDLDHPTDGWGYADFKRTLGARARWMQTDDIRDLKDQLNAGNEAIRGRLDRIDDAVDAHLDGVGPRALWDDTVADVRRVMGRGPGAVAITEEATGRVARVVQRFRGSRLGAASRLGGTTLGVVGTVAGGFEVYHGVREGDTEQVVTGSLGTVAGLAMMSGFPPAQLAGAVVTGGLLVYEYHDEIAAGARAVGRGIATGARAVADAATDHARQQVETAGRVARRAGDMAGAAASFLGGLF